MCRLRQAGRQDAELFYHVRISTFCCTVTTYRKTSVYDPLDFVRDYIGEPVPEPIWILLNQETEWQWHQLGHMQICTLPQTDNHASTPPTQSDHNPLILRADVTADLSNV